MSSKRSSPSSSSLLSAASFAAAEAASTTESAHSVIRHVCYHYQMQTGVFFFIFNLFDCLATLLCGSGSWIRISFYADPDPGRQNQLGKSVKKLYGTYHFTWKILNFFVFLKKKLKILNLTKKMGNFFFLKYRYQYFLAIFSNFCLLPPESGFASSMGIWIHEVPYPLCGMGSAPVYIFTWRI